MKTTYRNPRTFAEFTNWPYGRRLKTVCTFTVETLDTGGTHKERISKVTINPTTGRENKAKKTTFAPAVRIVDGSDGKTYLIQKSGYGSSLYVKKSDFFDYESIYESDERYTATMALFLFPKLAKDADAARIRIADRLKTYYETDHGQNQE